MRGLLNDAAYAHHVRAQPLHDAPHVAPAHRGRAGKRGIDRAIADAAISEVIVDENIDERAMVEAAAVKKLRPLEKLEPDVRRRRLYGFLARKGFAADLVRAAVKRLTDP